AAHLPAPAPLTPAALTVRARFCVKSAASKINERHRQAECVPNYYRNDRCFRPAASKRGLETRWAKRTGVGSAAPAPGGWAGPRRQIPAWHVVCGLVAGYLSKLVTNRCSPGQHAPAPPRMPRWVTSMRETHEMILNGCAKSGVEEWVCPD